LILATKQFAEILQKLFCKIKKVLRLNNIQS